MIKGTQEGLSTGRGLAGDNAELQKIINNLQQTKDANLPASKSAIWGADSDDLQTELDRLKGVFVECRTIIADHAAEKVELTDADQVAFFSEADKAEKEYFTLRSTSISRERTGIVNALKSVNKTMSKRYITCDVAYEGNMVIESIHYGRKPVGFVFTMRLKTDKRDQVMARAAQVRKAAADKAAELAKLGAKAVENVSKPAPAKSA